MPEILIVDSVMGSGKTSAMINYMNNHPEEKYLFITPYLAESKRIKTSCPDLHFETPTINSINKTKIQALIKLVNDRKNIATTHALFKLITPDLLATIKEQGYNLIMDEALDVVAPIDISSIDIETLFLPRNSGTPLATLDESGLLHWNYPDYKGVFLGLSKVFMRECVYGYADDGQVKILIRMLSPEFFKAFKRIFVLTYIFDAQILRCYFDYFSFEYKYMSTGKHNGEYALYESYESYHPDFKNLVDIYEGVSNKVGDNPAALSASWYMNHPRRIVNVKKGVTNFFQNYVKHHSTSKTNMWTTFKDYKENCKGKGYTKGFISYNTRATNEHGDKVAVAYLCNCYYNPIIARFFTSNGVRFDQDTYALSEMLQFIWRSAIRNGEKIYLYIPSSRMRNLFKDWLNNTQHPWRYYCRRR